jgi:hypothetical protein
MVYDYALGSPDPVAIGLDKLGFDPEMRGEWRVSFWLGSWDADVLCGFCLGRLSVPDRAQPLPLGRPAAPDPSVLRRRDRI